MSFSMLLKLLRYLTRLLWALFSIISIIRRKQKTDDKVKDPNENNTSNESDPKQE